MEMKTSSISRHTHHGFTLVELLIVIVVIAILSAITVILYDNIATKAYDTALKSDLRNAQNELEVDRVNLGTYPTTAAQAGNGQGLKASSGDTMSYSLKPYGYCITDSNPDASTSFVLRSDGSGQIEEGDCSTVMTIVAGDSYMPGFADGSASTARFSTIIGLAFDSSGNLFVADNDNRRIRKIAPDGTVSTFAGTGTTGNVNGPGASAQFSAPRPLVIDQAGNLWVGDSDNRAVRKITPDGTVSTLINPNTGTAAWFNRIFGMALAPDGGLYVMEWYQGRLYHVAPDGGAITVVAGTGTPGYVDGPGATAQFNEPQGIAVDPSGNIYVADTGNNRIRKVTPDGTVSTVAGNGTAGDVDGAIGTGELNSPNGVTIGGDGLLYVTQFNTPLIRVIAPDGSISTVRKSDGSPFHVVSSWGGGQSSENDLIFGPDGALYVTTRMNIKKIIL